MNTNKRTRAQTKASLASLAPVQSLASLAPLAPVALSAPSAPSSESIESSKSSSEYKKPQICKLPPKSKHPRLFPPQYVDYDDYIAHLSWSLNAFRVFIGEAEGRLDVIKNITKNNGVSSFVISKSNEDIKGYKKKQQEAENTKNVLQQFDIILNNTKSYPVYVTISEPANTGEPTHYILLIIRDKNNIEIFDPADNEKFHDKDNQAKNKMYTAPFIESFVKIYRKKKYIVTYKFTTETCQREVLIYKKPKLDIKDIFCQTWTLKYLIKDILQQEHVVPDDCIERFQYLLEFIKECVSNIPEESRIHLKQDLTDSLLDAGEDYNNEYWLKTNKSKTEAIDNIFDLIANMDVYAFMETITGEID